MQITTKTPFSCESDAPELAPGRVYDGEWVEDEITVKTAGCVYKASMAERLTPKNRAFCTVTVKDDGSGLATITVQVDPELAGDDEAG